jgi:prepilin-type N-terminal cleavage/methylation domain-containing protein
MLSRRDQESGFTLIELLLSIAILGILMSAFVGLMFATMTANHQTKSRLDGTRTEQISSVYFGRDIQSARSDDPATVAQEAGIVAGVAATCGPGTAVLEIRGLSYDPGNLASKVTVVSYVFSTAMVEGVTTGVLQRRSCEALAAPAPSYPLTPANTRIVARGLLPTAPAPVCSPAPCGATTTSVNLTLSRSGADAAFTLVGAKRTT